MPTVSFTVVHAVLYVQETSSQLDSVSQSAAPALLTVLAFLSTCQGLDLIMLGQGLTAAVVVNTLYRLLKNKLGEGLQGWQF